MLSAVIPSEHSYSAVPLAGQPIHQRFVLFGPLVLEKSPLKQPRLRQIETNLSHAYESLIAKCMDYNLILFHFLESGLLTFSLYG